MQGVLIKCVTFPTDRQSQPMPYEPPLSDQVFVTCLSTGLGILVPTLAFFTTSQITAQLLHGLISFSTTQPIQPVRGMMPHVINLPTCNLFWPQGLETTLLLPRAQFLVLRKIPFVVATLSLSQVASAPVQLLIDFPLRLSGCSSLMSS